MPKEVVKVTDFQKAVYEVTKDIPASMVCTYKQVACEVGIRRGLSACPRAVGQALRKNPFAPAVPCHRVISADMNLHGFYGKTDDEALSKKRNLLEKEGCVFVNGKVSKDHVYDFNNNNNSSSSSSSSKNKKKKAEE